MGARYRWGTALVVAVALAAGGGGTLYLVKQWEEESRHARGDDLAADASADASVARGKGKGKGGKKGARGGKPRGGGGRSGPRGGGGHAGIGAGPGAGSHTGGANAGGDNGGAVDNGGDDNDDETTTEERKPPPFRGRGPAGPTYEAAIASNKQEITIGKQGAPDLTDAQLSAPMRNGAFVDECAAPDNMKVTVHVAIKMGRPVGVSVATSPPDPDVAGCIDRYVRTFSWPSSPKMDSFKTTY